LNASVGVALSCIGLTVQSARRQPKNNCDFDNTEGGAGFAAGKGDSIHALQAQA
jgi:hypothetical protein